METMESRRMMSATAVLSNGTLTVTGDGTNNAFVVTSDYARVLGGGTIKMLKVTDHDVVVAYKALPGLQKLVLVGGAGNDNIDCSLSPMACTIFGDSVHWTRPRSGEAGSDVINGSVFADYIDTGHGAGYDRVWAQGGNDIIANYFSATGPRDYISGGIGTDTVYTGPRETPNVPEYNYTLLYSVELKLETWAPNQ
jgi:hypothetical protein